jgi:hypothetical protein
MITYYTILSEEHPRRLFNIMRLDLATNTFSDPILTTWLGRCHSSAEFQFRKLGFSGFLPEWKPPGQVISEMQNEGYIYDRDYYYCRAFFREMVQSLREPENVAIISEGRAPRLLDQLKPFIAEKNLRPYFYSIADPEWITEFTERHIGTYPPDKCGIPEFQPAPTDSQCGIMVCEGDISMKRCRSSFLGLFRELDVINTTVIVIVPKFFKDLDSAVEMARAGAGAVLRNDNDLLTKLNLNIDFSAPASGIIKREVQNGNI